MIHMHGLSLKLSYAVLFILYELFLNQYWMLHKRSYKGVTAVYMHKNNM